jgi:hypothetical protein
MGHASINTPIKHYGHPVKSFRKGEIKKIEGRMDTWGKVDSDASRKCP